MTVNCCLSSCQVPSHSHVSLWVLCSWAESYFTSDGFRAARAERGTNQDAQRNAVRSDVIGCLRSCCMFFASPWTARIETEAEAVCGAPCGEHLDSAVGQRQRHLAIMSRGCTYMEPGGCRLPTDHVVERWPLVGSTAPERLRLLTSKRQSGFQPNSPGLVQGIAL